ncbi:FMN-binding negative transcriptional regulator [Psychrobacter sp. S1-30-MNA-CIBAN-0213]|uniref:FMN-binding negative transcriptional regulator n=1 Tax=unclassified Psychrobacter TaxID=196806 RepID=UPI003324DC93
MHVPSNFAENNFDSIIDLLTANPLATLIAQTADGIEACHIPLFWHQAALVSVDAILF